MIDSEVRDLSNILKIMGLESQLWLWGLKKDEGNLF